MGGREASALGHQLYPIIFGVRGLLTCEEKLVILRNRGP